MNYVIVYITASDIDEAERVSKALVEPVEFDGL